MIPVPWGRILVVAALVAGVFALGWSFRGFKADGEIGTLKAEHAQQMKAISDTAAKAATDSLERQQDMVAANAKIDALQGDIAREKADAETIRTDLAHARRVVRLNADACPARGSAVPEAPASASVDPPAAVELPATVGADVFGIRAGITEDHAKIAALQEYATTVCQK